MTLEFVRANTPPDVMDKLGMNTCKPLPADLRKDLVLYYRFSFDDGNIVADKSGCENNAQVAGAKWIDKGKSGGGMSFDGRSCVIVTNSETLLKKLSGPVSYGAWICAAKLDNPWYSAVISFSGLPKYGSFGVGINTSRDSMYTNMLAANLGDMTMLSSRTANLGVWYHLFCVDDGIHPNCYINGEKVFGCNHPKAQPAPGMKLAIGNNLHASNIMGFNGVIDEVMFYTRALTDREVQQIYNSYK
jgi:hypothetical protein